MSGLITKIHLVTNRTLCFYASAIALSITFYASAIALSITFTVANHPVELLKNSGRAR